MLTFKHFAIAGFAISSLMINSLSAQQLKTPAPSPSQTIKQAFALSDVSVEYSRPSAKGRAIYGDLVPFGKIWRTGANAATKVTFGEDIKVEGQDVKAGTYALYTMPNKDMWDVMLYKDLTLGGDVSNYKAENEVLHIKVKPVSVSQNTETFTINFADVKASSMALELLWEKTKVAINITAEIDAKIMKNIESSVINDARPYYSAANYYYENDKDLKLALSWTDKALEQNPKAFWVAALKGKIQLKLKDARGAAESANKVIELAKEAKNDDYVKIGEKIISDTKMMK